jgi:hypothetical protein
MMGRWINSGQQNRAKGGQAGRRDPGEGARNEVWPSNSRRRDAVRTEVRPRWSWLRNSDYTFWVGMFMPSRTPADVAPRPHAEVKGLRSDGARERVEKLGAEVMAGPQPEFASRVQREMGESAALIKKVGMKID